VVDVEGLVAGHKDGLIRVQRWLESIGEVSPDQNEVPGHFDRDWHQSDRDPQPLNR
jgi:hypothetical protein